MLSMANREPLGNQPWRFITGAAIASLALAAGAASASGPNGQAVRESHRPGSPWLRLVWNGIAIPVLNKPFQISPLPQRSAAKLLQFLKDRAVSFDALGTRLDARPGKKLLALLGPGVNTAQIAGEIRYKWRGPAPAWVAAKDVFPPGHFSGSPRALVVGCPTAAGKLAVWRAPGKGPKIRLQEAALVFPRWAVSLAFFENRRENRARAFVRGDSWRQVVAVIASEICARHSPPAGRGAIFYWSKNRLKAKPRGTAADVAAAEKLVSALRLKPLGWLFSQLFRTGVNSGHRLVRLAAVLRYFSSLVPTKYPLWVRFRGTDGSTLYIAATSRRWPWRDGVITTDPQMERRRPIPYYRCDWWLFGRRGRLLRYGELSRMLGRPLWYDLGQVVLMSGERRPISAAMEGQGHTGSLGGHP